MHTLDLAFNLIASFEGLRLTSYYDTYGHVWTIGFGHTRDVHAKQTITYEEALNFFRDDTKHLLELVKDRSIFEAAAWVSFGYNLGEAALKKILLTNNIDSILNYNHAGGITLEGLTKRRNLEFALIKASRESH